MSLVGFIFFVLFAGVQVGMYLALRREWLPLNNIALAGMGGSVMLAGLMSLTSGNSLVQAIFVGLLLGLLIGGSTLAVALYFHNNERAKHAK
jgi:hypothetical protein